MLQVFNFATFLIWTIVLVVRLHQVYADLGDMHGILDWAHYLIYW